MKERAVIINAKTTILTTSDKSDEVVRKEFLAKLENNKKALLGGNTFGKSSFKRTKDKFK